MKIFLITLSFLFLVGCENTPYIKKTTLENKITEMVAARDLAVKEAVGEVVVKKDTEILVIKQNSQYASDWLYGTRLGLDMFEPKNRLWDITSSRLNSGIAYLPPPSREALVEQVKTLKEELDETKVSNEELNSRYNKEKENAIAALKLQEEKSLEAAAAVKKLAEVELEWEKKLSGAKSELIDLQNVIQANSDEQKRQDEWRRAQIMKMMYVTGALSLAALVGAIFVPVMKRELGLLAAILGGVTVALPFITPFYMAIVFGSVFVIVLGMIARKFFISNKSEKAVYRAIQEMKTANPEEYKKLLAPKLSNWTGKYDKDGEVAEDKTITTHIDKILIETEAK
jgi:hypothetical protein